ncbi:hypothetical protein COLO4_24850 [Corchorus olitorius]|uniref:Uncharacterized protein n=1 Tax=Corchorus olitorius TaxID=93759 RepID=A0A1R3I683_9ROSI|nr:hypothetical protein COLO4_24850 [Corchorus olitorius]
MLCMSSAFTLDRSWKIQGMVVFSISKYIDNVCVPKGSTNSNLEILVGVQLIGGDGRLPSNALLPSKWTCSINS